jgi:hypothetical protein
MTTRQLLSEKSPTIKQRGGMGILACIISFQILALIILPIMVYCYQLILYDDTMDQLESATEIVSFEILGNVAANHYSQYITNVDEDVSLQFQERLFNELGDRFDRSDFKNISAKIATNTLVIKYEYDYKDSFLKRDKWFLCEISYALPINN